MRRHDPAVIRFLNARRARRQRRKRRRGRMVLAEATVVSTRSRQQWPVTKNRTRKHRQPDSWYFE